MRPPKANARCARVDLGAGFRYDSAGLDGQVGRDGRRDQFGREMGGGGGASVIRGPDDGLETGPEIVVLSQYLRHN